VNEIDHDRNFSAPDVATVYVQCVLETRDHQHIAELREALRAAGVNVVEAR
jgi:threonine dehydratase